VTMSPRAVRAKVFAETFFPACVVHREEATAAFEVLEKLARRAILAVDADKPLADLLGAEIAPGQVLAGDSLDAIELQLAVEADIGDTSLESDAVVAHEALRRLLGPAAQHTTWAPDTIWVRSLRGIVNQRVRHRGGCTCAELGTPANNKMQQTSHG
jgi:hypothetical protein